MLTTYICLRRDRQRPKFDLRLQNALEKLNTLGKFYYFRMCISKTLIHIASEIQSLKKE